MKNSFFARTSDLFILALVVWREARGEEVNVQRAVAFSVLNRVRKPSWWGKDIMSVCTKKWQYSSMTDPKDRQLTTWPSSTDPSWEISMKAAWDAMNDAVPNPIPGADSYYDISIPAPKWADDKSFVAQLGRIRFHNLDHDFEAATTGNKEATA